MLNQLQTAWDHLQLQAALIYNGDLTRIPAYLEQEVHVSFTFLIYEINT